MILTDEQQLVLAKYIGQGPIDKANIIIIGNEFGSANAKGQTEQSINKFMIEVKTKKLLPIGEGFTVLDRDAPPVSSTFLQYISRLALGLKHNDDRFFGELSSEGKAFLNNYIMNLLYVESTAIINLRHIPQSTENDWSYTNINEAEYYSHYNFMHRHHTSDKFKDLRIDTIKEALHLIKKDAIIIGSGNKNNKKAFFEWLYTNIKFHEQKLSDNYKIFYSDNLDKKIILSNYFDNKTIGLSNLKMLYEFILEFKKPKSNVEYVSHKLF